MITEENSEYSELIFSCNKFYDAFSVTKTYVASNYVVIREWWIVKDLEGSGRGLALKFYPEIFLEWIRKTTKNLSQDSPVSGTRFEHLPNTKQEC
jgi:hypothetical protein